VLARRGIPVALVTAVLTEMLVTLMLPGIAHAADAPATSFPAVAVQGSTAPAPTAAGIEKALAPLVGASALGSASVLVIDPASGDVLLDRAGSTARTPASTTKLLTAAAALKDLGPGTRLATRVMRSSGDGAVRLTLVGGGDATLRVAGRSGGAASLTQLARRSAAALGTTKSVSLDYDASLFTGPALGAGWSSAIVRIGEVAPVSALTIAGTRASDPAAATAKAFAAELRRQGVKVTGIAKAAAPGDAAELARVESPAMSVLVQQMLTDSNNDLAESLGHLIGAKSGQGSFRGGAAATLTALQSLGLPTDGIVLRDASGLSHRDRIPATTQLELLQQALTDKRDLLWPMVSGLPVAGMTGTLADVVALSGTVLDKDGRLLLFSVLANKVPSVAAARTAVDKIAGRLAKCGCR